MQWQGKPKKKERNVLGWAVFLATVVGGLFTYLSTLPLLTPKVELVSPLAALQQITLRITIHNGGKTNANDLRPTLGWTFQKKGLKFEPDYSRASREGGPPLSVLGAGSDTTMYSTNPLDLAHEHDVNAVLDGDWLLFIYGKIRYTDILHISHEFHFCAYYVKIPGVDPLKFSLCPSYNETRWF